VIPKSLAYSLTLLALLGACHRDTSLRGGNGVLVAPGSVDVGPVYQGAHHQFAVTLANTGDATLNLTLALGGDSQVSLVSSNSVSLLAGDHQDVTLLLMATNLGAVSATLQITGDTTGSVALTAVVIADLVCAAPGPCLLSHFDPDQGQCIEQQVADNQPCDDGDPCTTNKACQGGLCKGVAATCEDNNVCTVDFCQPKVGCQHLDESSRCDGNDPCQIYYCDSKAGCQSSPAADYTPCDAIIPCQKANVCIGGHCTGVFLPDGIPCISPIDPCAKDGTCHQGQCDSPTANALKPGDVLWQVVSNAFSDGDGGSTWDAGDVGDGSFGVVQVCDDAGNCNPDVGFRAAATVDSDGNFYIDDSLNDGGTLLVSYDVCGNERWRDDESRSSQVWTNGRHVLSEDVLFTVAENPQTIIGQSPLTGTHLWEFDPQVLAGIDAGSFLIEDVALGNDGVLYYAADWRTEGDTATTYQRMIGGVLRNGQSKFQDLLPALPDEYFLVFGYPLLVDENENLYTVMKLGDQASAQIQSYDQTGSVRFTIPVPRYFLNSFSENQGFFLEPMSLTAFDSEGKLVWSLNDPSLMSNGHSPVVSADDHLSILRYSVGAEQQFSELDNFDPLGNLVWSHPVGPAAGFDGVGESSVVLDQQGTLYFLEGNTLYAVRESDGVSAFTATLPTQAIAYQGVLALTPAGSLIGSVAERIIAVFTGSPMSNAAWPRFRGDNANRSSPPPNSGGVSP
jgi:hypothetical protein